MVDLGLYGVTGMSLSGFLIAHRHHPGLQGIEHGYIQYYRLRA
jgi:hypothetical protein